jgi:murein DD-endopeptidase MepM/ murein hydrolase activator NlpD
LNRRKFLKYAGTSAAVVGASALGLDYIVQEKSPTVNLTTQTTSLTSTKSSVATTRELTTTSTSLSTSTQATQPASLQGRLFFDYTGNGKQDYITDGPQEPAVPNAKVQLKDSVGKVVAEAVTDSAGDYRLEDVKAGSYKVSIEADKKFRYMCTSAEEFRAVTRDYVVHLDDPKKPKRMDIELMEGYLTLPFAWGTRELFGRIYVDVNAGVGDVRDWNGGFNTKENHLGTDFMIDENAAIRSASPGRVAKSYYSTDDGNTIAIQNLEGHLEIYCHLNTREVSVNQRVNRGEFIGLSGSTGRLGGFHHLHFQFGGYGSERMDPYRDVLDPKSKCWWTKDNDPQYPF